MPQHLKSLRSQWLAALAVLVVLPLSAQADVPTAPATPEQAAMQKSKAAAQEYSTMLKAALQKAMKEGGAMTAIPVCHTQAPKIAQVVGEKYGLEIHRTSLKPRATPPLPWEKVVLEQFDAEKKAGKPVDKIVWHQTVEVDGKPELRLMKAIPTGEVCLSCHGTNVAPAVLTKIRSLYPQDKATGYHLGDIRGALSVSAPIQ